MVILTCSISSRYTTNTHIIADDNVDNATINGIKKYKHVLHIKNVVISDAGKYTCNATQSNDTVNSDLQPFLRPNIVESAADRIKRKIRQGVIIYCVFDIYPQNITVNEQLKWLKDGSPVTFLKNPSSITQVSESRLNLTLEFAEVYKKENGTYKCVLYDSNDTEIISKEINLLVMEVPQVSIDFVKPVGASKIFLNWTINDGNDPIQKYFIQYAPKNSKTFTYYKDIINGNNTSYVLDTFSPNTTYYLRITGKNSIGLGSPNEYHSPVTTLSTDPIFIPKVETTGSTASTITIGWNPPTQDLIEFIQYYELIVSESGEVPKLIEKTIYQQNSRNLPYMFDKLKTATDYEFQVRACSDLTKTCGPWSEIVNGTTMDGVSTKPTNLKILCNPQNISRPSSISVSWNYPKNPNGKIISYLLSLEGNSTYTQDGKQRTDKTGPKIRRVDEPSHKISYDGVTPNTNYTITVSAITRHKKNGEPSVAHCFMPVSTPENIGKTIWTKVQNGPKYVLKLYLPKISERNGPICCYRLYLVKIINSNNDLPPPDKLNVTTYSDTLSNNNTHGHAYLAEMFSSRYYKSEILLGDEQRFTSNLADIKENDIMCHKCLEGLTPQKPQKDVLKTGKNYYGVFFLLCNAMSMVNQ